MAGGARRKQRLLSITLYGTLLAACEGRGSSTPAAAASTSNHTQLLTFFALSDWGGESGPPFTTQDELCASPRPPDWRGAPSNGITSRFPIRHGCAVAWSACDAVRQL